MRLALCLAVALPLIACQPPAQRGRLGSPRGQPTEIVREGSYAARLSRRCGAPVDGELTRAPYVQAVGPRRASILWRSTSGEERVRVFSPGGPTRYLARGHAPRDAHPDVPLRATIPWLEPDRVYCYELLRDGAPVSGPFAFRTAPADRDAPVDVIAFGDSGTGWSEQRALAAIMERVPADLILHTGDVAYEDGAPGRYQETVFDVYRPLLNVVPIFPSIGNHDLEANGGASFRRAFHVPGELSAEEGHAYSFTWGPVHFVALDSSRDLEPQLRAASRELDRAAARWRVIYLHHPPYSTGAHGSDHGVRRRLAPLVRRHGVQLVLSGHDHHYERTEPIDGATYVVTGGGGREIRDPTGAELTAYAEGVHHFLHLRFDGPWLTLRAIDARGRVFDRARLRAR